MHEQKSQRSKKNILFFLLEHKLKQQNLIIKIVNLLMLCQKTMCQCVSMRSMRNKTPCDSQNIILQCLTKSVGLLIICLTPRVSMRQQYIAYETKDHGTVIQNMKSVALSFNSRVQNASHKN